MSQCYPAPPDHLSLSFLTVVVLLVGALGPRFGSSRVPSSKDACRVSLCAVVYHLSGLMRNLSGNCIYFSFGSSLSFLYEPRLGCTQGTNLYGMGKASGARNAAHGHRFIIGWDKKAAAVFARTVHGDAPL